MKRFLMILTATGVITAMSACGSGDDSAGEGGAPEKLIITAIPDDNADKLKENYGKVAEYLEAKLGIPVEYSHVENYAASVTALANGQAHLAWMGGVTTVQADQQTDGGAVVVACRDIDKQFKTYFIANKDSGIDSVDDLAELSELAAGKSFTFGSKGSTSGHLMPRHFFTEQSGRKPENVFSNVSYSGSHDLTLAQVADGSYAVGALNYSTYDKAPDDRKAAAPIVYTTPDYVDYSWVARKDLGDELIGRVRAAFLELDGSTEEGKAILGFFNAGKFVEADMSEWDGIRDVMESGVDIGS